MAIAGAACSRGSWGLHVIDVHGCEGGRGSSICDWHANSGSLGVEGQVELDPAAATGIVHKEYHTLNGVTRGGNTLQLTAVLSQRATR